MYLESREDLDLMAKEYATRPAMRRGIRLNLYSNAADVLLVIYWDLGRAKASAVIERIRKRQGGMEVLARARDELLTFHHFGSLEVGIACENVAYLIACALDPDWV